MNTRTTNQDFGAAQSPERLRGIGLILASSKKRRLEDGRNWGVASVLASQPQGAWIITSSDRYVTRAVRKDPS